MQCHIDKKAVAKSFSKAAYSYDDFSELQRNIGHKLFNQLDPCQLTRTLDLGCGTGYFSEKLLSKNTIDDLICFDLSQGMLDFLKKERLLNATYVQGDMDHLPFLANSFNTVFSNLALQWSSDLQACLKYLRQSLVTGGELHFSTLLNGSLNELKGAWQYIDETPHTNTFLDRVDIENILHAIGFSQFQVRTETITLYYPNVFEIMRALKGIGANHVNGKKPGKFHGRALIHNLSKGYADFKTASGQFPLSYQVCYIKATK